MVHHVNEIAMSIAAAVTRQSAASMQRVQGSGSENGETATEIKHTAFPPGGIHGRPSVIVADDDRLIREILRFKLEFINQTVVLAENGDEAVTLASEMQASLIILDVKMPKLDGLLACMQIRKLSNYVQTPIVMLTSDDTERSKVAASYAGASMYVVKPFNSASLILTLSRFLLLDKATLNSIHDAAVRAAGGRVFTKMRT